MDGINSLFMMIDGLFAQDRLLAVVKNFIYFPDSTDSNTKVVCRYPQFFAANNLYENVKAHMKLNGDGKGGTYFGTTGCRKSYTMFFLTCMIMKSSYFKSPTILMITDRTDLDVQLSKQFVASKQFIGDNNIQFRDLISLTGYNQCENMYKMACNFVHGSLFSSLESLDSAKEQRGKTFWNTSPSDEGIEEVIHFLKIYIVMFVSEYTRELKDKTIFENMLTLFWLGKEILQDGNE